MFSNVLKFKYLVYLFVYVLLAKRNLKWRTIPGLSLDMLSSKSDSMVAVYTDIPKALWSDSTLITWPCAGCSKVYRSKTSLNLHQRIECGKQPQHSCPICLRKFYHASSMNRHLRGIHKDVVHIQPVHDICK